MTRRIHHSLLDDRVGAHADGHAPGHHVALLEGLVVVGAHQQRVLDPHVLADQRPQADHRVLHDRSRAQHAAVADDRLEHL
jgi:hypothetical protein